MEAKGGDEVKGKALGVLHVLDDHLWTAGDQKDPEVFYLLTAAPEPKGKPESNAGALGNEEGGKEENDEGDQSDDQEATDDDEEEEEEFDEFAGLDSDDDTPKAKGRRRAAPSAQKEKEKENGKGKSKAVAKTEAESNSEEEGEEADSKEAGVTEEKMDELLEHAFVHALRESVKDSDLPLLASTLYSAHMQDLKPNGIAVDVKKSSHKKFAKFLKAMEKKGYMKTKEIKGIQSIMTIDRQSPALVQFQVTWFAKNTPKATTTPDGSKSVASSSSSAPSSSSSVVTITELYQPKSALALIFQEQGKE